jgi:cytochrome c oxidase subunit 4
MFMMVVKFWMVAAYFMHLKQDNTMFTRMFVGGLLLATGVYCIALSTFQFWA